MTDTPPTVDELVAWVRAAFEVLVDEDLEDAPAPAELRRRSDAIVAALELTIDDVPSSAMVVELRRRGVIHAHPVRLEVDHAPISALTLREARRMGARVPIPPPVAGRLEFTGALNITVAQAIDAGLLPRPGLSPVYPIDRPELPPA